MCSSRQSTVQRRSGSKTTMSASAPSAIWPLRGHMPMSFAGFTEMSSTHRSALIRPLATPSE